MGSLLQVALAGAGITALGALHAVLAALEPAAPQTAAVGASHP